MYTLYMESDGEGTEKIAFSHLLRVLGFFLLPSLVLNFIRTLVVAWSTCTVCRARRWLLLLQHCILFIRKIEKPDRPTPHLRFALDTNVFETTVAVQFQHQWQCTSRKTSASLNWYHSFWFRWTFILMLNAWRQLEMWFFSKLKRFPKHQLNVLWGGRGGGWSVCTLSFGHSFFFVLFSFSIYIFNIACEHMRPDGHWSLYKLVDCSGRRGPGYASKRSHTKRREMQQNK